MFSGLQVNSSKSELYASEVGFSTLDAIQFHTGFVLGHLPIRYLGVPLITKRLAQKDCKTLIKKITARITYWSANFLSYVGRLQLVQSVIFSMHNYWCRHFILPKGVIKEINSICNRFFWKGTDSGKFNARVAWNKVCSPKSEDGLGLKDVSIYNQACILRNLWNIFANAGSLWVAWIHSYVPKGNSAFRVAESSS